jgi:hypothetical protein
MYFNKKFTMNDFLLQFTEKNAKKQITIYILLYQQTIILSITKEKISIIINIFYIPNIQSNRPLSTNIYKNKKRQNRERNRPFLPFLYQNIFKAISNLLKRYTTSISTKYTT